MFQAEADTLWERLGTHADNGGHEKSLETEPINRPTANHTTSSVRFCAASAQICATRLAGSLRTGVGWSGYRTNAPGRSAPALWSSQSAYLAFSRMPLSRDRSRSGTHADQGRNCREAQLTGQADEPNWCGDDRRPFACALPSHQRGKHYLAGHGKHESDSSDRHALGQSEVPITQQPARDDPARRKQDRHFQEHCSRCANARCNDKSTGNAHCKSECEDGRKICNCCADDGHWPK